MTPGRPSDTRLRTAGLATGATLLLLVAVSAGGQSPPGCSGSTLEADILFPAIFAVVQCGTTVPFTVRVTNGTDAGDCDVSDLPVTFLCPDPATGDPTGPSTILATADDFTANPPSSQTYSAVFCVIGNVRGDACSCDSTTGFYQVKLDAGPGRVETNSAGIDTIEILKTASIECVTTTSVSTTTTTTTTPISRSFQCYVTKSQATPSVPVTLVDRFGSSSVSVRRPERLCAAVDESDQGPDAPANPQHLIAYGLVQDRGQFQPRYHLQVANRFGTVTLDAVRFAELLVPSAKSLTGPPAPLSPGGIDHFLCYTVRSSAGTSRFTPIKGIVVVDQFGGNTVDVVRPTLLCNPVDKNGETPGAEQHATDLLCYQTRFGRESFRLAPVYARDQFGPKTFKLIRRRGLCVASTMIK
jgi:hypothetical protein